MTSLWFRAQVVWVIAVVLATVTTSFETKPDAFMDLAFAVDRHDSINETMWTAMLNFVADFYARIRMEETASRGGLVSFDQVATLDIRLDNHDSNTSALQADLRDEAHGGFQRDISYAFWRLREDLFIPWRGDRTDISNVAVLITNGYSDGDWAKHEASLLQDQGCVIICIGVGGDAQMVTLLKDIAGQVSGMDAALFVDTFTNLPSKSDQLLTLVQKAVVPQLNCTIDVCVALDKSVTPTDWQYELDYVIKSSWMVDIDFQNSRVGLVTFDLNADLVIQLDAHSTFAGLREDILTQSSGGSGRNLSQALRTVREDCFNPPDGDRSTAPNVVVLVTSGSSDYEAVEMEAALLEMDGAKIITIGVGSAVNQTLLNTISTYTGDELNAFTVASYEQLELQADIALGHMCPVNVTDPAQPKDNTMIIVITCCTVIPALVVVIVLAVLAYKGKLCGQKRKKVSPETPEKPLKQNGITEVDI